MRECDRNDFLARKGKIRVEISDSSITITQNDVRAVIPILKDKAEKKVINPQAQ